MRFLVSNVKRSIPKFSHPLVETHCHLDYLKGQSIAETIAQSQAVGVEKMVTISVTPDNLDTALGIAKSHPGIYCSQGIHPHEAKTWSKVAQETIQNNAKEEAVVAIGEIGLDFYYEKSPRDKQREVFVRQLDLACELNLPIIVHSREADCESMEILGSYAQKLKRGGVIHSFTAGEEFAKMAISHGFYLGLNGIITFKNAENIRRIVRLCPLEHILLETDAPFLTPVPYRGRENAPFYLPFVAEKIAEIKNVSVESVLTASYKNAVTLFAL